MTSLVLTTGSTSCFLLFLIIKEQSLRGYLYNIHNTSNCGLHWHLYFSYWAHINYHVYNNNQFELEQEISMICASTSHTLP